MVQQQLQKPICFILSKAQQLTCSFSHLNSPSRFSSSAPALWPFHAQRPTRFNSCFMHAQAPAIKHAQASSSSCVLLLPNASILSRYCLNCLELITQSLQVSCHLLASFIVVSSFCFTYVFFTHNVQLHLSSSSKPFPASMSVLSHFSALYFQFVICHLLEKRFQFYFVYLAPP